MQDEKRETGKAGKGFQMESDIRNEKMKAISLGNPMKLHLFFRFIDGMNMLTRMVAGFFLVLMSLSVFCSVLSRYVLNVSWAWIEEGAVYLMIWIVALGASLAVRAKHMIAVEALVNLFPAHLYKTVKTLVIFLSILFLSILLVTGHEMAKLAAEQISTTLPWLKLYWVYLSIPVGAALMILNLLAGLLEIWLDREVES